MRLTFTNYLDARPDEVAAKLDGAVVIGLDEAARRVAAERAATRTEPLEGGVRVRSGVRPLDGGELRISGRDRWTVLEFALPWEPDDGSGTTYRAASAFVHTVADRIATAA